MTREEEILNASTVYHEEQFHCDGWNYDFIEGAKWADQHPRKGLWDSEKVITWIALHAELYGGFNQNKLNSMCEDLQKAMED